jgi:hypothetical protein
MTVMWVLLFGAADPTEPDRAVCTSRPSKALGLVTGLPLGLPWLPSVVSRERALAARRPRRQRPPLVYPSRRTQGMRRARLAEAIIRLGVTYRTYAVWRQRLRRRDEIRWPVQ